MSNLFKKQRKIDFISFLGKNKYVIINTKYIRMIVLNEKELQITVILDTDTNIIYFENNEQFYKAYNIISKEIILSKIVSN